MCKMSVIGSAPCRQLKDPAAPGNELTGNEGDDAAWWRGGDGNDVFYFGRGETGDTITDFVDGSDRIDISAFGDINADNFATNVTVRAESGGGVEVVIGDAVLTLLGADAADITADDFIFA